ncbi:hypothetical protein [Amycolatopsis suaedae]|uniref:DUF2269 domain-containing protein n=1 Tax=Amycolatopsis suaedae TaxID=2510978 RepID=A0A4Q7JCX7_9PSEU|nr:hypothetical protein [Amycolatopsis suaedae]RZQ65760.1 hypothetical protein EWH70_01350 [Amycolatopsis suaedae]
MPRRDGRRDGTAAATLIAMTSTATFPRMSPRLRKAVLLVHIVSSVSWLGINVGNLALALTGLLADTADVQRSAFVAMGIVGDTLLIPASLLSFVSGLWLGLGTQWGLLKYRWVIAKFVLTVIPVILIPLSLLPGIHEMVAVVTAVPAGTLADIGPYAPNLIVAGCVSTTMYLTSVVLSVYKPWGRTRRGRKAIPQRRTRTTANAVG